MIASTAKFLVSHGPLSQQQFPARPVKRKKPCADGFGSGLVSFTMTWF